jgi:hypothetical protein
MSFTYTCPACEAKLRTPKRVPTGKVVTCPKCDESFTPEPGEAAPAPAAAGTFKVADDETVKKPAKPGAKPEPAKAEAAAPAKKSPFADDDDESAESVKKGYGVIQESEEEKKEAEKNKPKFTEVQDKFKKSARGPAQSLLVMPSNLLTGEGLLTVVAGLFIFVVGMWPLVFNDAPPGEEELEESIATMLVGLVVFVWGALVCFGASQMQELSSYPLAMMGAVMGVLPLLVGIFGIVMLQNPKVKAGFEEGGSGPDDEDEDDEDEDGVKKGGDDEDDEDDDDEGGGGTSKTAKKVAKNHGRRLLGNLLGGGDDEEGDDGGDDEGDAEEPEEESEAETEEKAELDEDEEEEDRPRKKRKKRTDDEDDE